MNFKRLSLSGGGLNCILYIGSLKYLEECDILKNIDEYHGLSFGSIVSLLLIIGYTIDECIDIIKKLDVKQYFQCSIKRLLNNYGFDSYKLILGYYRKLLKRKIGVDKITLKELYDKTKKEFHIYTFNINKSILVDFNYKDYPDLDVIDCVYSSTCLPFIFEPCKINNNFYIDAGLILSIPTSFIKDENETLIIHLKTKRIFGEFNDLFDYIYQLYYSQKIYIENYICFNHIKKSKIVTIHRSNDNKSSLINIDKNEIDDMIKDGYDQIKKYFKLYINENE